MGLRNDLYSRMSASIDDSPKILMPISYFANCKNNILNVILEAYMGNQRLLEYKRKWRKKRKVY